MNKNRFLYIAMILLVVSLFFNFHQSHNNYPKGCDEFGYLQLSNELTGNSERELFLSPLISDLQEHGFKYEEYAWMILPHAYHVDKRINKPVNQYQPGTSMILAFLSPKTKQILFPVVVAILGFGLVLLLSWRLKIKANPLLSAVVLFFVLASFPGPFMTELSRINSLAFTFVPLLLAGFLLFSKPKVAMVLLLVCVNFRIANLVLLPVFGLIYLFQERGRGWLQLLIYGTIGLLPILVYNSFVFGNPFSLSYSSNDTSWSSISDLINNIQYYFNWDQSWFRYHVACLFLLLGLCFFKQITWKRYWILMTLVILNYGFFMLHKVQMNYYPYASLLILMGVLANQIKGVLDSSIINFSLLGLSFILLVTMIIRFGGNETKYQPDISVFKSYDVVWGDIYSSSSEYVNHNRGMRYFAGTSRARIFVVKWLKEKGYSQAFIMNDLQVSPKVLKEELNSVKFNGTLVNKPNWQIVEL